MPHRMRLCPELVQRGTLGDQLPAALLHTGALALGDVGKGTKRGQERKRKVVRLLRVPAKKALNPYGISGLEALAEQVDLLHSTAHPCTPLAVAKAYDQNLACFRGIFAKARCRIESCGLKGDL